MRVKWYTLTIDKDRSLTVKNCLAIGFTNLGGKDVYIDGAKIPSGGSFPLSGEGHVNEHQEFNIVFSGTGTPNLLVTQTLLKDEC